MVFNFCVWLATSRNSAITNASRGTANAWHFYYALVFVITMLCGSLVVALSAP
ncbi:DUF3265 domain-containing protein [Vibrio vulnificus]|nr:DUF3265 domain-containing protein [Vibrio cholerae]EJV9424519.1 DUF3265 domain-containing protein [Vibrio vulnificus]ELT7700847.1 DUF3265 domain-containing protein [Vibrio vulnificus]